MVNPSVELCDYTEWLNASQLLYLVYGIKNNCQMIIFTDGDNMADAILKGKDALSLIL